MLLLLLEVMESSKRRIVQVTPRNLNFLSQ
jgi:hypothetical protein